jgi:alanine racemase
MDSFLVDVGAASTVQPGDTVTLIGGDGKERLTFEENARLLGTINYELSCSISLRRAMRVFSE